MKRMMIAASNTDRQTVNLDAYRIESYTSNDYEFVDVTMYSGARHILRNDFDHDLYKSKTLVDLLDTILWSKDINEIID